MIKFYKSYIIKLEVILRRWEGLNKSKNLSGGV